MTWFTRSLRSGKEFGGTRHDPEARVHPRQVTATFKLAPALAAAESRTIAYIVRPDDEVASTLGRAHTASPPPTPGPPPRHSSPSPAASSSGSTRPFSPSDSTSTAADSTKPTKRSASPATQRHGNAKRRRKRNRVVSEVGHVPAPGSTLALLEAAPDPIPSNIVLKDLPAAHGGYFAKPQRDLDIDYDKEYTVDELIAMGFQYIAWDGIEPIPLYDEHGAIFAVLAGRPRDASYMDAADEAFVVMRDAGASEKWSDKERAKHRRGYFLAHNVGISGGKGQPAPTRLGSSSGAHAVLNELLLGNLSIQRLATFQSSAFQRWSPKLFAYYKEHMDALHRARPDLGGPNFAKSVFPCAAFNLSERSWSFRHRDGTNVPFGWCGITALAKKGFRPHLGGQIVLWDLRMIVQFPHASTILIPSATVEHSNIPPAEGDERLSFTQFAAGAIFRYVDSGFMNDKQLKSRNKKEFNRLEVLKSTRWEEGLKLYSTVDELLVQDVD